MSNEIIKSQDTSGDEDQRHHPIVTSCCGCCSLGAGSLIIAIIYLGLGITFFVTRFNELTLFMGKKIMLWNDQANVYLNIFRLLLLGGCITTVASLAACVILAVASCMWGHKETYKKIRKSIMVWCSVTSLLITYNIGEIVYVILVPSTHLRALYKFETKQADENIVKMISLAAVHILLFIYFVVVLVSYLRLLKYEKIKKLGGSDYQDNKATSSAVLEEKYYDLSRTNSVASNLHHIRKQEDYKLRQERKDSEFATNSSHGNDLNSIPIVPIPVPNRVVELVPVSPIADVRLVTNESNRQIERYSDEATEDGDGATEDGDEAMEDEDKAMEDEDEAMEDEDEAMEDEEDELYAEVPVESEDLNFENQEKKSYFENENNDKNIKALVGVKYLENKSQLNDVSFPQNREDDKTSDDCKNVKTLQDNKDFKVEETNVDPIKCLKDVEINKVEGSVDKLDLKDVELSDLHDEDGDDDLDWMLKSVTTPSTQMLLSVIYTDVASDELLTPKKETGVNQEMNFENILLDENCNKEDTSFCLYENLVVPRSEKSVVGTEDGIQGKTSVDELASIEKLEVTKVHSRLLSTSDVGDLAREEGKSEENRKLEKKEAEEEEENLGMSEVEIKKFFEYLAMKPREGETSDPVREMFRMFGGELCHQNPNLCRKYFKAYQNQAQVEKDTATDKSVNINNSMSNSMIYNITNNMNNNINNNNNMSNSVITNNMNASMNNIDAHNDMVYNIINNMRNKSNTNDCRQNSGTPVVRNMGLNGCSGVSANALHKLQIMEEQYETRRRQPHPHTHNQHQNDSAAAASAAAANSTDPFYEKYLLDTSKVKRGYNKDVKRFDNDDITNGYHLPSRVRSSIQQKPIYTEECDCNECLYGCYDNSVYGSLYGDDDYSIYGSHAYGTNNLPFPDDQRWSLPLDPRDHRTSNEERTPPIKRYPPNWISIEHNKPRDDYLLSLHTDHMSVSNRDFYNGEKNMKPRFNGEIYRSNLSNRRCYEPLDRFGLSVSYRSKPDKLKVNYSVPTGPPKTMYTSRNAIPTERIKTISMDRGYNHMDHLSYTERCSRPSKRMNGCPTGAVSRSEILNTGTLFENRR